MMDECPEQSKSKKGRKLSAFPVSFSWDSEPNKTTHESIMHGRKEAKSKTKLGSSATHIPWHLSRSILCQGNPIASDWTTLFCFLYQVTKHVFYPMKLMQNETYHDDIQYAK